MPHASASVRVLETLRKKHKLPTYLQSVIVSCSDVDATTEWLRRYQSALLQRNSRPKHSSSLPESAKEQFIKKVVGVDSNVEVPSEHMEIIALGRTCSNSQDAVSLPFSLASASALLRAQMAFKAYSAVDFHSPLALLESPEPMQNDLIDSFLKPGSKDLVFVQSVGDAPTADLEDTLTIGSYLLTRSGLLVLTGPSKFPLSKDTIRYARWRFNEVSNGATPNGDVFLVYQGSRTDASSCATRRQDNPAIGSKRTRRDKHWRPFDRKKNFVVAERPGFTNAPHVKESLMHKLERDKLVEEKHSQKKADFLNLSVEMMEKGSFNSSPNDET